MRFHHFLLATGLVLALASSAAPAGDSAWTVRFHGAIVDASVDTRSGVGTGFETGVDSGGGFGIGAEYRLSDRLGLEFSTLFAALRIDYGVTAGIGSAQDVELTMMPLTLAVPFHFRAGKSVDVFVGPTFSVVRYLNVEARVGVGQVTGGVDVETDTAFGAAVGIDVPIRKTRWAFSAGLRVMETGSGDLDPDPLILMLGFAHRF